MNCSPEDFPPYERVMNPRIAFLPGSPLSKAESTFIGHTIAWIVFGLVVANVFIQVFR